MFLAISLLPFCYFGDFSHDNDWWLYLQLKLVYFCARATKILHHSNHGTVPENRLFYWTEFDKVHTGRFWKSIVQQNKIIWKLQRSNQRFQPILGFALVESNQILKITSNVVCILFQLIRSSISYYMAFEMISNRTWTKLHFENIFLYIREDWIFLQGKRRANNIRRNKVQPTHSVHYSLHDCACVCVFFTYFSQSSIHSSYTKCMNCSCDKKQRHTILCSLFKTENPNAEEFVYAKSSLIKFRMLFSQLHLLTVIWLLCFLSFQFS